jgi:hypothetical protein
VRLSVLLAYVWLNVPANEVERLRFKLDAAGTALLRGLRRIHATMIPANGETRTRTGDTTIFRIILTMPETS